MSKTLLVVAVVLLATVAAVAATTSTSQPATGAPEIRTYLMPDFSLKSVISPALLAQPTAAPQTESLAAGPKRHGTCRCSCGYPCTSSADCGGSSCDPFITCCERKTQSKEAEWFIRSFDLSSHQTPMPEAIVKANCK